MKEYPKFFATGDVISDLQRERKMVRKNWCFTLLYPKSLPKKWGIDFSNIKSTQPLNCSCGSKNLSFTKGKSSNGIQAWCRDCGASFPVTKVLPPYLQHLVEPDPPPETRVCRYCGGESAMIADAPPAHFAALRCSGCNRWLKWLPKPKTSQVVGGVA